MNLERSILTILRTSYPYLMTMETLWSEVLLDNPRAGYSAFKRDLTTLEQKGQAVVIHGEDRVKVKITDAGQSRLME